MVQPVYQVNHTIMVVAYVYICIALPFSLDEWANLDKILHKHCQGTLSANIYMTHILYKSHNHIFFFFVHLRVQLSTKWSVGLE